MDKNIISPYKASELAQQLIGEKITPVQRGYGSALLLELGELQQRPERRQPTGRHSIMLEWSWRIENENSIVIGSWSDDELIEQAPDLLEGRIIEAVEFTGRLKELYITLSGGLWLASFMTAEGTPEWAIRVHTEDGAWLSYSGSGFILQP
jgi:hypothetical protein